MSAIRSLLLVAIVLCGCNKDEEESNIGCQTGVPKGASYRVLIRCCTQQQALAGNNVKAGGTANWTDYTDHKWEKCADCK